MHEVITRLRQAGCVFAEDEARLLTEAARTPAELDELVTRRVAGLPLEHLLGWAEFHGHRISVDPGVFVPRRRTEWLVDQAATLGGHVVVDLCCGTGAIGVALAAQLGDIELHAADLDPAAVRCARRNVEPAGGEVHQGDLYTALPPHLRGRVDLLVVNAPYVPTDAIATMPPEARDHEPRTALDGGGDGVEIHRRITAEATHWLAPTGHLLIETSRAQAPTTTAAFTAGGLRARTTHSAELDGTVVVGTRC